MSIFEWTEKMSVGEDRIDDQHKKLLSQINKIVYVMNFGATHKEVLEALKFFDDYAKEHFSYEEKYMKKYNYLYFDEHKRMHKAFIKNSLTFRKKLKAGVNPRELILDIETYLGKWFVEHICKEDKKYHLFIKYLE